MTDWKAIAERLRGSIYIPIENDHAVILSQILGCLGILALAEAEKMAERGQINPHDCKECGRRLVIYWDDTGRGRPTTERCEHCNPPPDEMAKRSKPKDEPCEHEWGNREKSFFKRPDIRCSKCGTRKDGK